MEVERGWSGCRRRRIVGRGSRVEASQVCQSTTVQVPSWSQGALNEEDFQNQMPRKNLRLVKFLQNPSNELYFEIKKS